ncbi:hypothetical protein Glove_360g83 [Diversispora epigaea]|uniref:F-box domain-containing protein n=1 Tax=Diversispora epigaea TaxID=1348612 RepID=A0A397HA71_9GLOM|nr:hypothetical protein Glove_360g83 [Diversispora epigaea]
MFRISKFLCKYSKESPKKDQNLPSLPCEFILPIICHLSNDKKSLCSCLLVNRFWCLETIKVLWSKPFKLLYTCRKKPCFCSIEKRKSQAANLLSTYLSCLLHKYKDSYIQNKSNFTISSSPLFYYIDYLHDIDLNELYSAVEDWIKSSSNKKRISADILKFQQRNYLKLPNDKYNYIDFMKFLTNSSFGDEILPKYSGSSLRDLMVHVVVKAFMTQCPKLERISIDLRHTYTREQMEYFCSTLKQEPENLPVEIYETLNSYTGNGPCLDQLTELICTTRRWKSTLLLSLAKFAHNIKYLIITISYQRDYFVSDPARVHELPKVEQEASCLAMLVQSQKALKHFGLHVCSEGLPTIMSALESQVISLNSISFVNVKFSGLEIFENIRNFKNLQTLSIKSSSFDRFTFSLSLKNLEFSFLKELNLDGTYISAEVLEKLFLLCPRNLESLGLGKHTRNDIYMHRTPRKVLILIATLFPNLKNLKASIYPSEISQLCSIFTYCQDLSHITLIGSASRSGDESSNLLLYISEINQNLKELRLEGSIWSFSSFTFEMFLKNRNILKNLQVLEIIDSKDFGNQHLQVIIKCLEEIDDVALKKLVISSCEPITSKHLERVKRIVKNVSYQKLIWTGRTLTM